MKYTALVILIVIAATAVTIAIVNISNSNKNASHIISVDRKAQIEKYRQELRKLTDKMKNAKTTEEKRQIMIQMRDLRRARSEQ